MDDGRCVMESEDGREDVLVARISRLTSKSFNFSKLLETVDVSVCIWDAERQFHRREIEGSQ